MPGAVAAVSGPAWYVRHLIQVGLWVHRASFLHCGMPFQPTVTMLCTVETVAVSDGPKCQLVEVGGRMLWVG